MRKLYSLFIILLALFAVNKVSANKTGDVITGYVTCVEKDGSRHSVEMMFQITSAQYSYVRIYGYHNASGEYNSLSLYDRPDRYEGCEIIVPEKLNIYTVKAVGNYAFYLCKAKVTLPESITDVEARAFEGYAYDGYDFQLPSKVQYLGEYAFAYSYIKAVSLNANLKTICNWAFFDSKMESLIIPKSVGYIGVGITCRSKNLQLLEVQGGYKNYYTPSGSNVIMEKELGASGQPSKTIIAGCRTSRIPEETFRIGANAFADISFDNPTITIPESVGVIARHAFLQSNIKQLIVRPEKVVIQNMAFHNSQLRRIDFYGGSVTIEEEAFSFCEFLEEVYCWSHIPDICHPMAKQFFHCNGGDAIVYAKYPDECRNATYEGEYSSSKPWTIWFKEIRDISEGESTVINEVRITDFDWPLGGQDADYTATSLTPHATVSNINYQMYLGGWKDIDPKPAVLGETYSIGFTITLDEGYVFGEAPKLYIDDREADLRITSSATETQMKFVVDNYVVPAPPGGVPIKSVSIRVTEPVEGQPLSTEVTNPTGKKYLAMNWVIDTVYYRPPIGGYHGEPYDPQNTYYLHVVLTAKEGYTFAADGEYKLNGQEAKVVGPWLAGSPNKSKINLSIVYGNEPPDTTYITTLNLTVAEPVEGEVPVAEVISPTSGEMEAMGYKIRHIYWQPEDTPYDKSKNFDFRVTLEAIDDYTFFTPDVQVTLNGHTATLYGNPLSYYTANKDKRCIIDWVYTQTMKGDVDGNGSINSADVVAIYNYILIGEESGIKKEDADVDGNGEVNSADIVAVYNIIIGGE